MQSRTIAASALQWNFQTSFRYLGIENRVNPNIYHFTRFPKPWMGECEPWADIYEPIKKPCSRSRR